MLDLNQQQHRKSRQLYKNEFNYKTALSIIQDNPDTFNDADLRSLVTVWFGEKATEVLDKDAYVLKCGVGTRPGAKCKTDECLLYEVCVHKDIKPLEIEATNKSDASEKSVSSKKIKLSKDLGINK